MSDNLPDLAALDAEIAREFHTNQAPTWRLVQAYQAATRAALLKVEQERDEALAFNHAAHKALNALDIGGGYLTERIALLSARLAQVEQERDAEKLAADALLEQNQELLPELAAAEARLAQVKQERDARKRKLLAIAGHVNTYHNSHGPDALAAFAALRAIADVLGPPMEPEP